jgi:hypothetical protein
MKHIKATSKQSLPARACEGSPLAGIQEWLDSLVCEMKPDKEKCQPVV